VTLSEEPAGPGRPEGELPPSQSTPSEPPPSDLPPSEPPPSEAGARRLGLPFGWGIAALALIYLAGVVTGAPPYRGLGFWVDENLLDDASVGRHVLRAGAVVLRSTVFDAEGNQLQILAKGSLGTELVVVCVYLLLGVLGVLLLRRRRPELLRAGGGQEALRTLGVMTPLVVAGAALGVLIGANSFPQETTSGLLRMSQPMLALTSTAVVFGVRFVILGPLAEEVLWRGVVYGGLRQRLAPVPAAVVSALAFVGWHYLVGWRALPPLLLHYVFALVACRLTEVTRSLWPALGLHVLGNACAFGLYALLSAHPNEVLYVLGLPR
jgi:membrane protease YdiL (CAAX protease family)